MLRLDLSRVPAMLAVVFLLSACATGSYRAQQGHYVAELQQARAMIGPEWPIDAVSRSTTAGDISTGNLDGQIEAMQRQLQTRPNQTLLVRLARAHYHRFQISGRLDDAIQARTLLSGANRDERGSAVDLSYARVLIGFHEFELALDALARARQNGADADDVSAISLAIQREIDLPEEQATKFTEADPATLVAEAHQRVARGQIVAASRLLKQAQDSYPNTAPYTLAWIFVQQGIVFLRCRDYQSARVFFKAARQRLPQYSVATEHLAETELALGNHREAADLYRAVATQTGNPEFHYQLAVALRELGEVETAQQAEQIASDGYAALLERYPLMWADHAARYYLEVGDTGEALRLATINLAARKDLRARTLMIETNLQAGNVTSACSEFAALRHAGYASPELHYLAPEMQQQCR